MTFFLIIVSDYDKSAIKHTGFCTNFGIPPQEPAAGNLPHSPRQAGIKHLFHEVAYFF